MSKKGIAGVCGIIGILILLFSIAGIIMYFQDKAIYDEECLKPYAEKFCENINHTLERSSDGIDGIISPYIQCYDKKFRSITKYSFTDEEKKACGCFHKRGFYCKCNKQRVDYAIEYWEQEKLDGDK